MKLSEINQILSRIRKERNLSQHDIAKVLNVEQAAVSMYENGKRGIPLDLLDDWLNLLEIEVKVTPKGFETVKPAEDTENDLEVFNELKIRRNYLVAELRAVMAEKLLQIPEFQKTEEETGENMFWPYSFHADEFVGLIETRYDHPEQKYLAVEYTSNEVNVYKFLAKHEVSDGQEDREWLDISRIYFSEDDFLTFGGQWDQDSMDMRRITILRKNKNHPDGVDIIDPEGFSVHTLVEMMENHNRFSEAVKELELDGKYVSMEQELETIGNKMLDIVLNNRLANGSSNPDFIFWSEEDLSVIDVPLYESPRNWAWIEEGLKWEDNPQKS